MRKKLPNAWGEGRDYRDRTTDAGHLEIGSRGRSSENKNSGEHRRPPSAAKAPRV